MKKNYLILDLFVDEPACFGVPPFISPYPRYIFGALIEAGVDPQAIHYLTIEELREGDYAISSDPCPVFIVGGAVVPGRYLGHQIGTKTELSSILTRNPRHEFFIGGPIAILTDSLPVNATKIIHDIEAWAFSLAQDKPQDRSRTTDEIARWSVAGAAMVRRHPEFPRVIAELESFRGCPRLAHCTFCSEGLFPGLQFREISHIIDEVDGLLAQGIHRFRLGRQSDIIQYKTRFDDFRGGFSRPNPTPVIELFGEIETRRKDGAISVFNVDNANPGSIVNFPDESAMILEAVAAAVSPGDTLPLGIESFDEEVMRHNNLKVTREQAFFAVSMINEIGGYREKGVPKLLPGINLIHGLRGEDTGTFRINYEELTKILDAGLLLRRINIRQVMPFPGTSIGNSPPAVSQAVRNRFLYYRDKIRDEIDSVMIKKIFPPGLILDDVLAVEPGEDYSYGRQIASYAVTLKFPMSLTRGEIRRAVIIGHNPRSLMAIPAGQGLNELPIQALSAIPGIGKKGASEIIVQRPLASLDPVASIIERIPETIAAPITQGIPRR